MNYSRHVPSETLTHLQVCKARKETCHSLSLSASSRFLYSVSSANDIFELRLAAQFPPPFGLVPNYEPCPCMHPGGSSAHSVQLGAKPNPACSMISPGQASSVHGRRKKSKKKKKKRKLSRCWTVRGFVCTRSREHYLGIIRWISKSYRSRPFFLGGTYVVNLSASFFGCCSLYKAPPPAAPPTRPHL